MRFLSHLTGTCSFLLVAGILFFSIFIQTLPAFSVPGDILRKYQVSYAVNTTVFDPSPAIGIHGNIYAGSNDFSLFCLDPDGGEKWRYRTSHNFVSTPMIGPDGTIYFGSGNHNLFAMDDTGTPKWTYDAGAIVYSVVLGTNNTLYCSGGDGSILAVSTKGELKWRFLLSGPANEAVGVDKNGVVYAGTTTGKIVAISPDGTRKWEHETTGRIQRPPAIDRDNVIYFGADDDFLYAIYSTGTIKWRFQTGGDTGSPVTGPDGEIYVGAKDGILYCLDTDSSVLWRYETGGPIVSTPLVASDGNVYIASKDGYLYCISSVGSLRWDAYIGETTSSPVLDESGELYIHSRDGYLYAVETGASGLSSGEWPMYRRDPRHWSKRETNHSPVADAGHDMEVAPGEEVMLDGSRSYDPDFGISSYQWSQTDGRDVGLEDAISAKAGFTAPQLDEEDEMILTFQLSVTDTSGITQKDTVSVKVEEPDAWCFIKSLQ